MSALLCQPLFRIYTSLLFAIAAGTCLPVYAEQKLSVDEQLTLLSATLNNSPEKSVEMLTQLQALKPIFSEKQRERYFLLNASSLGFRGKQAERIALVKSFIGQVSDPDSRIKFLYELSEAYTVQGDYENALKANYESVLLVPKSVNINTKISALQGAINISTSLLAYDEAMAYADQMYSIWEQGGGLFAKCYGLANRIEISILRRDNQLAVPLVQDAMLACDAGKRPIITLIVKALAAIDMINNGQVDKGINVGLLLLGEFSKASQTSDYVTQLEEAIARGYIKKGNLALAEQYAMRAYQRATSENAVQLREKTSKTLAVIKRAQGQLNSSLDYLDINLMLKDKILGEQLNKNLAYQRVKFDIQDKANQLTLLEQKNKILTVEKVLQKGKNQNLLLWITLGMVLFAILAAWLLRTMQQKSTFRNSSQVDGLTQVSNRAHFIVCATKIFQNTNDKVTLVIFDMDFFKNINDTFGHAAGDWVLKTVCQTVKAQLSKTEIFGRLGGEEFAICLPASTGQDALAIAESYRVAIAAIDTSPSGFSFLITASFGIATRDNGELCSFEETLAAADKALYCSKNGGRNRVSVYQ